MISFQDPLNQLPEQASTFAPDVDGLFYFCTWVSIFFFFLILGLLAFSSIKYRRRTPDQAPASSVTHNTTLEIVWTAIPTVILMVVFAWGWKGNLQQAVVPGDALEYRVTAFQWGWNFFHPGDPVKPESAAEDLYVPLNTPVKLVMDSRDVLHSLYIPAFRQKRDVVPGRYQVMWFKATRLGEFPIFCAEYCGDNHSKMVRTCHVVSPVEFETRPWAVLSDVAWERGEQWYRLFCASCHSIDGSPLIGPTFKGVWGRKETLADGSEITVDEPYVHESIRSPQAKIVKEFAGKAQMTPFPEAMLSEQQISDIIEFFKSDKLKVE